jgi:polysaccharide export outer membrane protein
VGEPLTVVFSDLPTGVQSFEEQVNDRGMITLLLNKTFTAAGKTRPELEKEIRAAYVPDYFVNLTVTIKRPEQLYYVGGEVRSPNRYAYASGTTVTKAIQAAGDFTDWANKKNVTLTRADGRSQIVDCIKALKDPKHDPHVYPGDKITVRRRVF